MRLPLAAAATEKQRRTRYDRPVAWYRDWFGEEYLELYAHRDAGEADRHIDFVASVLAPRRPRRVLDLACGAGRHSTALARRGFAVCGVDLSLTLLGKSPDLARVRGDMRRLPFAAGAFDWVLNFFTSFGYFESERENFHVLEEIARVLAPGGGFLIDLMNLDHALANLKERESHEIDGRRVEIERRFDAVSQRMLKRIRVDEPGQAPRSFLESVRAYREDEVVGGLRWAGLDVASVHGSFRGEPFRPESERLILIGRRHN
ncbi:MAG: methyltransferase domain-containing protein [Holophagales bacterium]|nr:MAG: methyltransferase domain-containing protein [Holophagales bacterium]